MERRVVGFGEETGNDPDFITPFDDGFYAQCPGVVLCKWTGSSFVRATEEEQRRHEGPTGCRGNARDGSVGLDFYDLLIEDDYTRWPGFESNLAGAARL
jgi:hypothetical protein